ncbi:hypothetical protein [Planotetraspora mira]|uniref:hypothetical protein n=1 Tax=Planotetraspora mira TaxID=58121 RepID=UPI00194DB0D1|nr:hypothetical protein [Planotetraspora mira]
MRLRAYLVEFTSKFPVTKIDGQVLPFQEPPGGHWFMKRPTPEYLEKIAAFEIPMEPRER